VKLVVTGSALADIERLHAFLKNKNRAAAQHVVSVLDGAMQSLRTAPERGRRSDVSGARELIVPFGRSAYVLRYVYSAAQDEIIVFRIWHGREQRD
jgi:plasmid stabilization system protein ParE